MKIITIGRGERCDIIIDDNRVSRQHAILRITPFGKMDIIDQSQNGTWVNGIKLRSNTPFPVKRKDVVNFAGAKQLDWTQVYNPMRYVKYCLGIIFILVLIIFAFVKFDCDSERIKTSEFEITPSIERTDSEYEVKKSKSIEKKIDEDEEEFLNKKKRITVDNIIPVVRITQKKKNEQVDTSKQVDASKQVDTSKQVDASKQVDTSKQVDRAKQKREDKKNIVL